MPVYVHIEIIMIHTANKAKANISKQHLYTVMPIVSLDTAAWWHTDWCIPKKCIFRWHLKLSTISRRSTILTKCHKQTVHSATCEDSVYVRVVKAVSRTVSTDEIASWKHNFWSATTNRGQWSNIRFRCAALGCHNKCPLRQLAVSATRLQRSLSVWPRFSCDWRRRRHRYSHRVTTANK